MAALPVSYSPRSRLSAASSTLSLTSNSGPRCESASGRKSLCDGSVTRWKITCAGATSIGCLTVGLGAHLAPSRPATWNRPSHVITRSSIA